MLRVLSYKQWRIAESRRVKSIEKWSIKRELVTNFVIRRRTCYPLVREAQ